jgi:Metallo-beta-lactamase superfamily
MFQRNAPLLNSALVRAHRANRLMLLPEGKLKDRMKTISSVRRLADLEQIETILVGDGWSIFSNGHQALEELVQAV